MFTRRELFAGAEAAAFVAVANKLGLIADAAVKTPDTTLSAYLRHIDWKPMTIDSVAAAEEEFHFEGIPYADLDEVARIHGGTANNWDWLRDQNGIILEGRFAAKLKEDPNFNDTFVTIDPQTAAEGYQLLEDPGQPNGFREQRIVAGPGVDGPQSGIWAKGLLVRRDKFTDAKYRFILSKRIAATVDEHNTLGTNHTVIGINGSHGRGSIQDPGGFKPIPFSGLSDVAIRYGGRDTDYEWTPGEDGFAARLKVDTTGHRYSAFDTNDVFEGKQSLWSPRSVREQSIVLDS